MLARAECLSSLGIQVVEFHCRRVLTGPHTVASFAIWVEYCLALKIWHRYTQPMISKSANTERTQFAERLKQSLADLGYAPSASPLTRIFNSRSNGAPITLHAFRKWLTAESIPTQPRLCVLAAWLQVTPEWLRYGDGIATSPESNFKNVAVPREIFLIVKDYNLLNADAKQIFDATLASMLAVQGKASPGHTEQ